MAYIGQSPSIGNFQVCDAISTVNGQAAYTMQVSSVNVVPETANHMIVSLNGIIQAPGSSYTVAGSTITFASNLATGDVINFIHILGSVLDLGVPSDSTVSLAKLTATGTKSSSTFLRGDNTFAAPIGGSQVLLSTSTISSGVSEVDITSNIDGTYKDYMFKLINIHPATDAAEFNVRFFQGGSVVTSSDYDWSHGEDRSDGSETLRYSENAANVITGYNVGNANSEAYNATIQLFDPASTTFETCATFQAGFTNNDADFVSAHGGFKIDNTTAVTGLRFYFSAGNVDSGVIKLYGIT